jgi:hypothetical protein
MESSINRETAGASRIAIVYNRLIVGQSTPRSWSFPEATVGLDPPFAHVDFAPEAVACRASWNLIWKANLPTPHITEIVPLCQNWAVEITPGLSTDSRPRRFQSSYASRAPFPFRDDSTNSTKSLFWMKTNSPRSDNRTNHWFIGPWRGFQRLPSPSLPRS